MFVVTAIFARQVTKKDDSLLKTIPIDVTFQDIHSLWKWKEIKNCPGRYVNDLSPLQFMTQNLNKLYETNENYNEKMRVVEAG